MSDNDAIGSRSSATTGNSVVVVHSDSVNPRTGLQSKPNSMAKTKDGAFSDEDDSAERAAILQSPPKGMQRLSSRVSTTLSVFSALVSHSFLLAVGYRQD